MSSIYMRRVCHKGTNRQMLEQSADNLPVGSCGEYSQAVNLLAWNDCSLDASHHIPTSNHDRPLNAIFKKKQPDPPAGRGTQHITPQCHLAHMGISIKVSQVVTWDWPASSQNQVELWLIKTLHMLHPNLSSQWSYFQAELLPDMQT